MLPLNTLLANLSGTPCQEQWEIVQATWPDGIPLTEETLVKANKLGLNLLWLARNLVSQAYAKYKKIEDPAWAKYKKIEGQALAKYKKIEGQASAEYRKIQGPALLQALKSLV
jgi:uncharacterized protein YeaC (DUF1315 family)